jgi:hypothetical protein
MEKGFLVALFQNLGSEPGWDFCLPNGLTFFPTFFHFFLLGIEPVRVLLN